MVRNLVNYCEWEFFSPPCARARDQGGRSRSDIGGERQEAGRCVPRGCLTVAASAGKITHVLLGTCRDPGVIDRLAGNVRGFAGSCSHSKLGIPKYGETPLLLKARRQLEEYFAGTRRCFDLPLAPSGTPFQMAVWEALKAIPYGETSSYGEIAVRIGTPKSCRAVGGAIHWNPIAIVIPCHRVIGADGGMTGFGAGLEMKRMLLELEGREIIGGRVLAQSKRVGN